MILTFIAPSAPHPMGGVAMIYEFAGGMAARGHEVHLFHIPMFEGAVNDLHDIGWFSFPDGVTHHFPGHTPVEPESIPAADVMFGYSSEEEMPPHVGLPVVLIQGYRMLGEAMERRAFHAPAPKVCIASWLVDVGRDLGVPRNQLVHVPLGLRHDRYRVVRPIDGRPPRVSVCYSSHPQKGAGPALGVLTELKRTMPDLDVVMFGAQPPEHEIPSWVDYRVNPPQAEIVEDIYNGSRVFLFTSEVEGFGLPCIEAMACGAALVTTDNGGSRDYAEHGRTALVSAPGDVRAMVDHAASLLVDDAARIRLAEAGRRLVRRFDWSVSGEQLEGFLERYLADPVAFGRPPHR